MIRSLLLGEFLGKISRYAIYKIQCYKMGGGVKIDRDENIFIFIHWNMVKNKEDSSGFWTVVQYFNLIFILVWNERKFERKEYE